MKVLIVEDEPTTLHLMKHHLREGGFDTAQARSIDEAIVALQRDAEIRIILLDLMFPGGDGFQLLRQLKTRRHQNKAVIVTSGRKDQQAVMRSVELGAKAYLVKPVEKELLLNKVNQIAGTLKLATLVVDDDPVIRDLLFKSLSREGYNALKAESGEEALKMVAENTVSTVISDIAMPGMSGLELLKALKEKYPSIKVLLITGNAQQHSKEEAIAAGADGFISKPFKNVDILRTLAALENPQRATV